MVDGNAVRSCVTSVGRVAGKKVTSIPNGVAVAAESWWEAKQAVEEI